MDRSLGSGPVARRLSCDTRARPPPGGSVAAMAVDGDAVPPVLDPGGQRGKAPSRALMGRPLVGLWLFVAALAATAASASAAPFVYVANEGVSAPTVRQRLPVRRRRGRAARPPFPGHGGRRQQFARVAVSPDGESVYVANAASGNYHRLPVRRRRRRGALAQEPGHRRRRHQPVRGGGEPGRRLASTSPTSASAQRLPVRRRRRRGALAQEPGHGRRRRQPVRGGGEPGRRERLRHQPAPATTSPSTTSARAGRSRPKSPATVAAGSSPSGWR